MSCMFGVVFVGSFEVSFLWVFVFQLVLMLFLFGVCGCLFFFVSQDFEQVVVDIDLVCGCCLE